MPNMRTTSIPMMLFALAAVGCTTEQNTPALSVTDEMLSESSSASMQKNNGNAERNARITRSSSRHAQTAGEVEDGTSVHRDEYSKMMWIVSPTFHVDGNMACSLRTLFHEETGWEIGWYLYVSYSRSSWVFLDSAYDTKGRALQVVVVDRKVRRYGVTERVAVQLDESYLRSAAVSGIDIKVAGRRGSKVIQVPPEFVQGFLAAVEKHGPK